MEHIGKGAGYSIIKVTDNEYEVLIRAQQAIDKTLFPNFNKINTDLSPFFQRLLELACNIEALNRLEEYFNLLKKEFNINKNKE